MKLSYGESNFSRASTVRKYFRAHEIPCIYGKKTKVSPEKYSAMLKKHSSLLKEKGFSVQAIENPVPTSTEVASAYVDCIYGLFPGFKNFETDVKRILSCRLSFNLPIIFKVSKFYQCKQFYKLDRAKSFSFRTVENKSRKFTMYVPDEGSSPLKRFDGAVDKLKMRRATLPNFVHHLDSLVLELVVQRFRLEKKPIFCVHDAFYVTLNDISFVKRAYYDALQNLSNSNPYKSFLLTNKICKDEVLKPTEKELEIIDCFNKALNNRAKKLPGPVVFQEMCHDILDD